MNTDTHIDKISVEAAHELKHKDLILARNVPKAKANIKSACEKAHGAGYEECRELWLKDELRRATAATRAAPERQAVITALQAAKQLCSDERVIAGDRFECVEKLCSDALSTIRRSTATEPAAYKATPESMENQEFTRPAADSQGQGAESELREVAEGLVEHCKGRLPVDSSDSVRVEAVWIGRLAVALSHRPHVASAEPTPEQLQQLHDAADKARERVSKMSRTERSQLEEAARAKIEEAPKPDAAALVGSCSCMTKTPEVKYHATDCRYRILSEQPDAATAREWTLESLGDLLQGSGARRYGWQVICDAHNAAMRAGDELWRERFNKFEMIEDKFGPAKQRAATVREWTVSWDNMIYQGDEFIALIPNDEQRNRILAAHNAAIAAEREKYQESIAAEAAYTANLERELAALRAQQQDRARLDWLNRIDDRANWIGFWQEYMAIDIREAIDAAIRGEGGKEGK